jgi:hypothetical protein
MMGALTTIHRVLYPTCPIGFSHEPSYRDWGIAETDQAIQINIRKN